MIKVYIGKFYNIIKEIKNIKIEEFLNKNKQWEVYNYKFMFRYFKYCFITKYLCSVPFPVNVKNIIKKK